MKTDHTLTVDRLRELIDYDAETGNFRFRDGSPGLTPSLAGRYGRVQLWVAGRMYYAARLAYAHHHGHWPFGQVDHINGDHTDNRVKNLRDATNAQNAQNRRQAKVNNSSGLLGVTVDRRSGRSRARIQVDGRMISLGFFATPEEAHHAYIEAKRELHPYWVEDVT